MSIMNRFLFSGYWLFGAILVTAGFHKLSSPNSLESILQGSVFGMSILLDVSVGALFFAVPNSRKVAKLGVAVFAIYSLITVLKFAKGGQSCDCFGPATPIAIPMIIDLIGVVFFVLASTKLMRNELNSQGERLFHFLLWLSLVVIVSICGLVVGYHRLGSNGLVPSNFWLDEQETEGWRKLSFEIKNHSRDSISLVGIGDSCSVRNHSLLPFKIGSKESRLLVFYIRLSPDEEASRFFQREILTFIEKTEGNSVRLVKAPLRWGVAL
jgi:hypothetical protein